MTQGRSGNWTRRNFELPDARLVQAEREIYAASVRKIRQRLATGPAVCGKQIHRWVK